MPLEWITPRCSGREGYAAIQDKYETGDPEVVFLPVRQDISTTNQLLIWPAPASITTASTVTGTDSTVYTCIKSHTTLPSPAL